MFRYILAVFLFFLLAGGASAAAFATGAPVPATVAFLVCLGLFVAAIIDSVAELRPHHPNDVHGIPHSRSGA
jgi:hypothetical protein